MHPALRSLSRNGEDDGSSLCSPGCSAGCSPGCTTHSSQPAPQRSSQLITETQPHRTTPLNTQTLQCIHTHIYYLCLTRTHFRTLTSSHIHYPSVMYTHICKYTVPCWPTATTAKWRGSSHFNKAHFRSVSHIRPCS